jgi:hypothetical protein
VARKRAISRRKRAQYSGIILVMCLVIMLGLLVVIWGMANGAYTG